MNEYENFSDSLSSASAEDVEIGTTEQLSDSIVSSDNEVIDEEIGSDVDQYSLNNENLLENYNIESSSAGKKIDKDISNTESSANSISQFFKNLSTSLLDDTDDIKTTKENTQKAENILQFKLTNIPSREAIDAAKANLANGALLSSDSDNTLSAVYSNICDENVKSQISILFTGFLCYFGTNDEKPSMNSKYIKQLASIVQNESTSLNVEYSDILTFSESLADWIHNLPRIVLDILDITAKNIALQINSGLSAGYKIKVQIYGYNVVKRIRELNLTDINKLVSVEGICVKRSERSPQFCEVWLLCKNCNCDLNGPYDKNMLSKSSNLKLVCIECQSKNNFIISREKTIFQNYQKIVIQEATNTIPAGVVPRQKTVILLDDLVDSVKPGMSMIVSGIYHVFEDVNINAKTNFPLFNQIIIANSIKNQQERIIEELTSDDIEVIKRLSKNKNIRNKIIKSIAPSIWGHKYIKTCLALVMFGGNRATTANQHTIRGDINFLILGDPGLGKSQFLKYVERIFPRTILTTGKGASGVGLTAHMKRDSHTGEWSLEGGAFVIADEGICLIDEFDKMAEQDRVSIHEAMEQQSISISKAGIVASLRAQCSVIAAANPIGGCYNSSVTLRENVDLSDPILSRFDIIGIVKDMAFPVQDYNLANHVLNSHHEAMKFDSTKNVPEAQDNLDDDTKKSEKNAKNVKYASWITNNDLIPEEYLTKYIIYARKNCVPNLQAGDETRIVNFYSALRQATAHNSKVHVSVRHLESILRLSVASAKMRLSPIVSKNDVDFAISIMLDSFMQSQRQSVARALGKQFGLYRALANGLDELVEQIVFDSIAKKYRCSFSMVTNSADKVLRNNTVSVSTVTALMKSLHAIPEQTVIAYIQTSKGFKDKFNLVVS